MENIQQTPDYNKQIKLLHLYTKDDEDVGDGQGNGQGPVGLHPASVGGGIKLLFPLGEERVVHVRHLRQHVHGLHGERGGVGGGGYLENRVKGENLRTTQDLLPSRREQHEVLLFWSIKEGILQARH